MNGSTMIRTVAVHRPTPPVPCGTLRVGRHTRWRIEVQPALIPRSADQPISRSPPPLLLAQGRASCRTLLRAPDLSRSRHLDVLLSRSAVRQAGLSVAAQEAAVAGFNEQLAALRWETGSGTKVCACCKESFELYCFPADNRSPGGRFHYCSACKANVRRQNRRTEGKGPLPPTVNQKYCSSCGVLRLAGWFGRAPTVTGLKGNCIPCLGLYDQRNSERHQRERELREPITRKWCSGCERELAAQDFNKDTSSKSGYHCRCRECASAERVTRLAMRQSRMKNETLVLAVGEERVCSRCNTCKPWSEFTRNATSNLGIQPNCKKCVKERRHMYYLAQKIG